METINIGIATVVASRPETDESPPRPHYQPSTDDQYSGIERIFYRETTLRDC